MKNLMMFFLLVFTCNLLSQEITFVPIGKADKQLDQIVIPSPEIGDGLSKQEKGMVEDFVKGIRNDFSFYKHMFSVIDFEISNSYGSIKYAELAVKNINYVVAIKVEEQSGKVFLKIKTYSIQTEQIVYQNSAFINSDNLVNYTHSEANAIYRSITGRESIFGTKIYFTSDRSSIGKDTKKELYSMDFDGKRPLRLTYHDSIVISPAVSHDGNKILYSVINTNSKTRIKNLDLNILDVQTKKISSVSNKKGINSGAIFSQDDQYIYLTLSYTGNADIYKMNMANGELSRITNHFGEDVDPSINTDGTLMTFLSNRSGKAHIYTMDPRSPEKDLKRISFVGQYNAAPRFSANGKEIVFSSWIDKGFDLYKIDSQGQNLLRLTKDFGSNEEASFSPDGEFILFTSQRILGRNEASQDVYIMNREGEVIGKISNNLGKCSSPRWAK